MKVWFSITAISYISTRQIHRINEYVAIGGTRNINMAGRREKYSKMKIPKRLTK